MSDFNQQGQQIDFVDLLFDFERRKAEGIIQTERIDTEKIRVTVFQKHPFEADVTVGEVLAEFTESQLEDLAYDQDIKIANLKKRRNEVIRGLDAEIKNAENSKSSTLELVLKEIKKLEKEHGKNEKETPAKSK